MRRDRSVPLPLASLTRTWVVVVTFLRVLRRPARAPFVNFTRTLLAPAKVRVAAPVPITTGLVGTSSPSRFAVAASTERASEMPQDSPHRTRTVRAFVVSAVWICRRARTLNDALGGVRSVGLAGPGASTGMIGASGASVGDRTIGVASVTVATEPLMLAQSVGFVIVSTTPFAPRSATTASVWLGPHVIVSLR